MLFYFYLRRLHFGLFISSLLISLMYNPLSLSIKYFLSYPATNRWRMWYCWFTEGSSSVWICLYNHITGWLTWWRWMVSTLTVMLNIHPCRSDPNHHHSAPVSSHYSVCSVWPQVTLQLRSRCQAASTWRRNGERTEFDIKKVFRPHGIGSINIHTRPLDPLETL